jgi:antitoxin HigA-1
VAGTRGAGRLFRYIAFMWRGGESRGTTCPAREIFVSGGMSKRAFEKIKQGLDDARAFLDGAADMSRYRVRVGRRRPRAKRLDPILPGEILAQEFMKPNGISQNRLSRDIDVNPARINDIVHGRSAITAAIALRLGKYFGTTPELWMNLQASYELRLARAKAWPKIERRVRILAAE